LNKDSSCENGSFFSLSPVELSLLSFAIALVLGENFDEDQRALLGNFLVAVGDNIGNLTSGAWGN